MRRCGISNSTVLPLRSSARSNAARSCFGVGHSCTSRPRGVAPVAPDQLQLIESCGRVRGAISRRGLVRHCGRRQRWSAGEGHVSPPPGRDERALSLKGTTKSKSWVFRNPLRPSC
jgi:hypothetical protein